MPTILHSGLPGGHLFPHEEVILQRSDDEALARESTKALRKMQKSGFGEVQKEYNPC